MEMILDPEACYAKLVINNFLRIQTMPRFLARPTALFALALLLCLLSSRAIAQGGENTPASLPTRQPLELRLNLAAISIGTEFQLFEGTPLTLMLEAGTMHGAFDLTIGALGIASDVFDSNGNPYPFLLKLRGEARLYHNWARRTRLGRKTDRFNGNYFALGYLIRGVANARETVIDYSLLPVGQGFYGPIYPAREVRGSYDGFLHLSYGIQRTFGNNQRWFYDFQFGYSYWVSQWYGSERIYINNTNELRLGINLRAAVGIRLR